MLNIYTIFFEVFYCLHSSFSTSPTLCVLRKTGLVDRYLPEGLWDAWRRIIVAVMAQGAWAGVVVSTHLQHWAHLEPGKSSRFPIRLGAPWYLADLPQEVILKCLAQDCRWFRKITSNVILCPSPELMCFKYMEEPHWGSVGSSEHLQMAKDKPGELFSFSPGISNAC